MSGTQNTERYRIGTEAREGVVTKSAGSRSPAIEGALARYLAAESYHEGHQGDASQERDEVEEGDEP